MKHLLFVFMAALFGVVSCGLEEMDSSRPSDGIWYGPAFRTDRDDFGGSTDSRAVCYVTAVDYPEGYNWHSDTESGTVRCSLVVFKDGIPAMKVPIGEKYETGADPDMHRIIGGHLYTDYSTSSETVIKKDGKTLFRYPGRERLCGMVVTGNQVHTLGQPRSGEGFSYRTNGSPVVERPSGYAFEHLVLSDSSVCMAFCERIQSPSGDIGRYYMVKDGEVVQTALREDVKKVWDIIVHEGRPVYVATLVGIDSPVLVDGENTYAIAHSRGAEVLACRLFLSGGNVYADCTCCYGSSMIFNTVWCEGNAVYSFGPGKLMASHCPWEEGLCCAVNPAGRNGSGSIFRGGENLPMPQGYAVVGDETMTAIDGILHVGLSSLGSSRPLLWKDSRMDTLDVNGYIASVTSFFP